MDAGKQTLAEKATVGGGGLAEEVWRRRFDGGGLTESADISC